MALAGSMAAAIGRRMRLMKAEQLKGSIKQAPRNPAWTAGRKPLKQAPPPQVAPEKKESNRRKRGLLVRLGAAVLVALALVLLVTIISRSASSKSKEAEAALASLNEIQRDWWDNEGLRSRG